MANRIRAILVTGLGTGYIPLAPGTFGSAACCGLYLLLARFCVNPLCLTISAIAIALISTILCILLGTFTETHFGKKDPSQCTIDEWAGQAAALAFLPSDCVWSSRLISAWAAFVAFRIFDVLKPPPIRKLEKLPGGYGVVADDLLAGLFGGALCLLLIKTGLLPI